MTGVETSRTAPATPNQAQLFFLHNLHAGSHHYNVAISVALRGPLDAPRLARCLELLVDRHEGLRTGFRLDSAGTVTQFVRPAGGWRVERDPVERSAAEIDRLARELAGTVFDLEQAPLLRARLLRGGPEEHTLVLVFHHIVIDAWSVGILFTELSELYNAAGEPTADRLPPAVSYLDATAGLAADPRAAGDLAYWRDRLAGMPAEHVAPGRTKAAGGLVGALHSFRVSAELTAALHRTAARHRCSAFVLMLAALRLALGRRLGRTDLTIGCPVAGRHGERLERAVGFLVNTLPVRTVLPLDASPSAVIEAVRAAALDALDHQNVPLARIVSALRPDRELRENPLFDVTCQQQNAAEQALDLRGVRSRFAHIDKGTTQFTLSLDTYADEQGLSCVFEYSTEVFGGAEIRELARDYVRAVAELTAVPPAPVPSVAVPAGPAAEDRPAAEAGLGADDAVARALADALGRAPERPALVDVAAGRTWTYRELARAVDDVTRELRAGGVRPGDRVAVAAPRSASGVVLMLATLLAGATYCPLDERLGPAQAERLLRRLRPVRVLGEPRGAWEPPARALPAAEPDRDGPRIAYVVHTSGSTGEPKQVEVALDAFHAYLGAVVGCYRLGPDDRVLHFASPGFDVAIEEVVPTVLAGGTVVVAPAELGGTPERFLSFVADHDVTVVNLPSSFWHRLVETLPDPGAAPAPAPTPLRLVVLGSEPLRPASVLRWRAAGHPSVRLLNAYGVSECTPTVAVCDLTEVPIGAERAQLPIGSALDHAELLVLDDEGRPAGAGQPGTVAIAGPAAPPWTVGPTGAGEPAARRLFRTGDAGRLLPDGTVELTGRTDRKFKRRGVLVDPAGIERVLTTGTGISEAVVAPTTGGQLAAALELPDGGTDATGAPRAGGGGADPTAGTRADQQRVRDWAAVHDDESFNEHGEDRDPTLNTSGWLSAIDRRPLTDRVMTAWVNDTVEAILRFRPRRILEIGCGTGMLLFRLAGHAEHYTGLDISSSALDYVARTIATLRPELSHVQLRRGAADALAELGVEGPYDAVVLHSVVQYFPGVPYLAEVLEAVRPLLAPRAVVHVGDVRALELRRPLYLRQLTQAGPPAAELALVAGVEDLVNREEELLLAADFFTALAGTRYRVETFARRPWVDSELVRYRFDARLFHGDWEPVAAPLRVEPGELERALGEGPETVVLPERTHPLLAEDLGALDRLYRDAGLATLLDSAPMDRVDPVDRWRRWYAIAARHGYRVLLPHGLDASRVDVTFVRWSGSGPYGPDNAVVASRPRPARAVPSRNDPLRRERLTVATATATAAVAAGLTPESVPTATLVLERFPRAVDGQLLRAPLVRLLEYAAATEPPGPDPATPAGPADPVAEVWCAVLGRASAADGDNFFARGGDSILALRLVARLRGLGYPMNPALVFRHQTLGELRAALRDLGSTTAAAPDATATAAVPDATATAEAPDATAPAGRDGATGPAGPTPMAHWFHEQRFPVPDRYQQSVLLELAAPVPAELLADRLAAVAARHPALAAHPALPGRAAEPATRLLRLDPDPDGASWAAAVERARALVGTEHGPTLLGLYAPAGAEPARLLLVAHHLRVDAVSWNVILDDLDALIGGRRPGPVTSVTPAGWVAGLRAAVRADRREAEQWRRLLAEPAAPLFPDGGRGRLRWYARAVAPVPGAETVGEAEPLLLAALGRALTSLRGTDACLVDREVHGRDAIDLAADQLVGWLATSHPLRLTRAADPAAVRHELRRLPGNGARFLAYRFLGDDPLPPSPAQVCFTYLGRGTDRAGQFDAFRRRDEPAGEDVDPANVSAYALDVVVGGDPWQRGLLVRYAVDTARMTAAQAERFGELFAAAVAELAGAAVAGPADAAEPADPADPVRRDVDAPPGPARDAEVTPMQASMLLHTAARPDSLLGIEQTVITLAGRLDPDRFRRAVEEETSRYDLLRSSFHLDSGEPRRRVWPAVRCPVEVVDLAGLDVRDQVARIEAAAAADLAAGIDPAVAPTMRWTLFGRGGGHTTLIWTHHHVILDGWSAWTFFSAVLDRAAGTPVGPAEPAPDFDGYAEWLRRQDPVEAERHWAQRLAGLSAPLLLFGGRVLPSATGHELETVRRGLPERLAERVLRAAERLRVTPGTIYLGGWLRLLAGVSGRSDVVCGTTVSHRPETAGADATVGLHVATVPVLAPPSEGRTVGQWLPELQQLVAADLFFCYLDPVAMGRSAGRPGRLHDTHFLYQNYPRPSTPEDSPVPRVVSATTVTRTGQPLTLVLDAQAGSAARTRAELVFDRTVVDRPTAGRLLGHYLELLDGLTGEPDHPMAELPAPPVDLLPPPAPATAGPAGADAAGVGSEPVVRRVLARLLGTGDVPPHANFFDIGARSVVLIQARAELTEELGHTFPVTHFFEYPTVRELADVLDRMGGRQPSRTGGTR